MFEVLKFNDQFYLERKLGRIARGFQEGDVEFAPTFKRLFNSFDYNAKRIPSWTDRIIFYKTNDNLIQKSYDSNNLIGMSDHKPVFSQFLLKY